jgi:hypothetical protein
MGNSKKVFYWTITGCIAAAFFITGIGNLIPIEHIAHDMSHLGYPPYFRLILGTWKILAAVAIIWPRTFVLKEWAYAGMIFDLTGAAFSRAVSGDNMVTVAIPILIAILVITARNLAYR